MDITDWRDKIDEVDRELVALLNRRAGCVLEIARIKQQVSAAIYEPQREEEIFRNIAVINGGPLDQGALRRVFERIIDEGRSLQRAYMERPAKKE